jgi:uncharacterized repeat protein (TIGR03943 family)
VTALWKGIVLRVIGLFVFVLWIRGSLPLYIHERFVWLVVAASIGLVWIGAIYHSRRVGIPDHDHHHHGEFSWGGLFLVLLPIIFGLTAPQAPLGADALRNRSTSVKSMTSLATPSNTRVLLTPNRKRTILDWVFVLLNDPEGAALVGEQADVTGFVYHDEGMDAETFLLSRFVVSCCAADAVPVSLPVFWSGSGSLENDQWVEVSGHFAIREIAGNRAAVLIADTVTLVEMPEMPYLYP